MKLKQNRVETANTVTDDLTLVLRNLIIQGQNGTLSLDGSPITATPSTNVAIYDPDIVTSTGNRYKTWAEVMAQVTSWGTVGGQIVVRKSGIFQTAVVPVGTYDLSKVWLTSDASSLLPILSFADGTTLSGFPRVIDAIIVEGNNTVAPLHTVSVFGICVLQNGAIRNSATATKPVISIPLGGNNFTLTIDTSLSPIYKNGGVGDPIFIEGTLSIDVWRIPENDFENAFFNQNDIFTNGLSGNGSLQINTRVLIPGGYVRTDANYDGATNINHRDEIRVSEMINNEAGVAARNYLYGGASSYVTNPIPLTRNGFSNEPPASTFNMTINPGDPIQDRRVIILEGHIYVGEITGGVLSARAYKIFATFNRNGAINSLTKDLQIVSSSPSSGGPACTITAYDDGSGHVGLSVQNNTATTIRIFIDMSARVVDDASRGPYFNS